jgi:hypothetical protein
VLAALLICDGAVGGALLGFLFFHGGAKTPHQQKGDCVAPLFEIGDVLPDMGLTDTVGAPIDVQSLCKGQGCLLILTTDGCQACITLLNRWDLELNQVLDSQLPVYVLTFPRFCGQLVKTWCQSLELDRAV